MIAMTVCINLRTSIAINQNVLNKLAYSSLFLGLWKFLDLRVIGLSIIITIFIQKSTILCFVITFNPIVVYLCQCELFGYYYI